MSTPTTHDSAAELLRHPRWRASDLGAPLPDSPHAVSVALPLWAHVVGYEEGDPAIHAALQCGYPRFVFHPAVQRLFDETARRLGRSGEAAAVFPSESTAARCRDFVAAKTGASPRVAPLPDSPPLHAVLYPEPAFPTVKAFWQHFGDVVSSRRAMAALAGRAYSEAEGAASKARVRELLARFSGAPAACFRLYSSGMGAVAAALRLAQHRRPGARSIQLGFPYVDVLKIQQASGPGAAFFPNPDETLWEALDALLHAEPIAAVVCELPGNPLLRSVDPARLAETLRPHGVPLIIDDTPGTFYNLDLRACADFVASSLTKNISGVGDVMAGSLMVSPESPLHDELLEALDADHEDLLYGEDAAALARNAVDFPGRMARINATAETLCEHLRAHPAVARVYYPKYETPEAYRRCLRPDGGYAGLLSLDLHDAAETAPAFYDRLRISKGPSLGANFSLVCPYTLLAHYQELDWAESVGVSRWLVRVSVGLEDAEDLIARFDEALPG